MSAQPLVEKNTEYLITESVLRQKISFDQLMAILRGRRTTGQLTIELLDGGVRMMKLTEKTKASEPQREKIREILAT